MKDKITDTISNEIMELYKDGVNAREIAAKYNVSHQTIYYHVKKRRVALQVQRSPKLSEQEIQQVRDLHNAGVSWRQLVKFTGYKKSNLYDKILTTEK